jgi:hypothetical protein
MRKTVRTAAIAGSALALLASGTAFAQGGPPGGSGGGAGGGGGGGGGGGTASCAKIGLTNSIGYYSVWAAIWTRYNINSTCSGPSVTWRMTYTNDTTGAVELTRYGSTYYGGNSGTVDEDWAAKSTTYTVTMTVAGSDGAVITSQSTSVTTGP